jgi:hypothetical protein
VRCVTEKIVQSTEDSTGARIDVLKGQGRLHGVDAGLLEIFREKDPGFFVQFPYHYGCIKDGCDGCGAPPAEHPLELHLTVADASGMALVRRVYDVHAMFMEEAGDFLTSDGTYDNVGELWAQETAAALRALADEIEQPLKRGKT